VNRRHPPGGAEAARIQQQRNGYTNRDYKVTPPYHPAPARRPPTGRKSFKAVKNVPVHQQVEASHDQEDFKEEAAVHFVGLSMQDKKGLAIGRKRRLTKFYKLRKSVLAISVVYFYPKPVNPHKVYKSLHFFTYFAVKYLVIK